MIDLAQYVKPDDAACSAARRMAFRVWFGLTRGEAEILNVLFRIEEEPLSRDALAGLTGLKPKHVWNSITIIRRALEAEAIDTIAGGYRLTDVGRSECKAVLWLMGEELRRAA